MLAKQRVHASTVRLCLLVLMLCGVLLTGSQATGAVSAAELSAAVASVESSGMVVSEMAENAPLVPQNGNCSIAYAGGNHEATYIQCKEPIEGAILWVAVPRADAQQGNHALATALTAASLNKKVWVGYFEDTSSLPSTCSLDNCRLLHWIYLTNDPTN